MKQLFSIENNNSGSGQLILSLRLGKRHAGFAITNKTGLELYQLAYCAINELSENEIAEFLSSYPCLQNSFYEVQVVYDSEQSVLISSKNYKQEDAGLLLSMTAGNNGHVNIVSELIAEWQLYNVYAVPQEIQEYLLKKFPAAGFRHQYSLGIKNAETTATTGSMTVDFRPDDFTAIIAKAGKILLVQTFEYSTPEDVLYYLLKTCQQFSLSQQEVQLKLSGLVDKQSSLYKELYQYFIQIEFREASWNAGNDYPAHFFTSLNDLAKCAL